MRNREIWLLLTVLLATAGGGAALAAALHAAPVPAVLAVAGLCILEALLFTLWRYDQIRKLASYLRCVSAGERSLDIRDNREGELSILKSEIYKVTLMLSEQAELLRAEKGTLSDALSDISHQVKTPLTSLYVMTDLLAEDDLPEEKRLEFHRKIHTQLERIEWLVSALLKIAKLDAGTVAFRRENLSMQELLRQATAPVEIPMELRGQTLQIKGRETTRLMGDLNWTSEALLNILKNCVEHTPCGGEITIHYEDNPIYTLIRVEDNGPGIAQEDLPYLFNRFYKGKHAGEESVGIGLAMARSILEAQGGTVTAQNRREGGARFDVKLYKNWKEKEPI